MRTSKKSRDVVVVGRACRLPGAASVGELWQSLREGRCAVREIPADRWSLEKHGHPRQRESGKSYVWAAGTIDDVWSFDPSVFGISPREVEQMDPQQRILLELTWEALEDAGIRRSDVAGTNVGVFVGASSTEYQTVRNADIAGADGYSATGGALSIVSNRISYVFDFRGPSFTVDTACSSSLVALSQALAALKSGEIDTAIVAGVNVLLSPYGFVLFSQASMLSPNGLCRTFDAKADGYVRSEGGVVLVLRTAARAARDKNPIRGRIVAAGVNSDGRTNGIALPSRNSQRQLLADVYRRAGIAPEQLSFVEAHGTGTRVGDPIEASVIGEVLGKRRAEPLLVGSIKSNIGHLEPGSGLAGVLKALLAFEHDVLPPSINFDEPNPDIDFDDLNLAVCTRPTSLAPATGPRYAGINSFGFGGTNAHVIVADAPSPEKPSASPAHSSDLFVLSAATKDAVRSLARRYAERLSSASFEEAREVVAAAAHQRELLEERAIVTWNSPRDLIRKLERIADKEADVPGVVWGSVVEAKAPVAFVFSGNGAQWPGMGRDAYRASRRFRESFDEIDAIFDAKFGWSVTEALFAEDIAERLRFTHIAQPLIFAIQVSVARALRAEGLEPSCVVGHSVGEISAAAVSGALSLQEAVAVIQARSKHQEMARDLGRMAVVVATREQVEALCREIGDEAGAVEIAAENSARAFTVAGPTEAIARLGKLAHRRRIVFRQLDLDYPFHCHLVDPVEAPVLADLADLKGSKSGVAMISTVTGELVTQPLTAHHWWRNIREPVRFSTAIDRATQLGARIFVEIGPRSILQSNMKEVLETTGLPFTTLGVLERGEPGEVDPIRPAILAAVTRGADVALDVLFGPKPAATVRLPSYPWARREFRPVETAESVGSTLTRRWHGLLGSRSSEDVLEWTRLLDSTLLPELADHRVGGQAILPGAAFIEIALAAARDWLDCERPELHELDITQPLPIDADRTRELKVRISAATSTVEILSRPRLTRGGWTSHAVAQVARGEEQAQADPLALPPTESEIGEEAIYAAAESVGLRYGPAFRLLHSAGRIGDRQLVVELRPADGADPRFGIDPARLDACFHGLFALFGELGAQHRGTAYIPVRFGQVRIDRPGALLARAIIEITKAGTGSMLADFTLLDEAGERIGQLLDARFQAARVERASNLAEKALVGGFVAIDAGSIGLPGPSLQVADILRVASPQLGGDETDLRSPDQLLLEGWSSAAGLAIARRLAGGDLLPATRLSALRDHERAWLQNILRALESSELASSTDAGWTLAPAESLPEPDTILRTLSSDHPERSTELLLAGRAGAWTQAALDASAEAGWVSANARDGYDLGGIAARAAGELILRLLGDSDVLGQKAGLRVLQVGFGPLSFGLSKLVREAQGRLTVLDLDLRRTERARLALEGGHLAFADDIQALPAGGFDVIVSAEGLHRLALSGGQPRTLRDVLAPRGLLIAVEPIPSLFRDLTLGLSTGWFGPESNGVHGPILLPSEWSRDLEAGGFAGVSTLAVRTSAEEATLIVAEAGAASPTQDSVNRSMVIQSTRREGVFGLPDRLAALLDIEEVDCLRTELGGAVEATLPAGTIVLVFPDHSGVSGSVAALRQGALALIEAAEICPRSKGELWVVLRSDGSSDPVAAGLAAFARTLANENATLTVRRITIEGTVEATAAAATLQALLRTPQVETDIVIGPASTRALRVTGLEAPHLSSSIARNAGAAKLERGTAGGLAGLGWQPTSRPEPGRGEVEIAVEATGLNFRDVMWAMSLLPDDILEDGFAGPTLGLECAGEVTRVGQDVTRFRPGDCVLAFAPSAFSTAVAVPEDVVMPVPATWRTEAAAGVPVAFLTAYYGLVTLGRIKAGDWVLIHGAAGGVGLAAIQIAHWRGATVIATAGSPEKRDLLRSLGVEHVLNSRSTAFAEDIRRLRRGGVELVLNSLSGEAMERSISVLKPFGRFIELGKRDYVANTRIGLRPFKRNLSYFGVDVDQLLWDREQAGEILAELMRLFDSGELTALPYRVFGEGETLDAFRLMQQSGHIGKILLRPSRGGEHLPEASGFRFDPEKTHLVTGGFGGFGLEAARWLADQGVRHLALLGRSGAASEEAKALVEELEARGVTVAVLACDVANAKATQRALDSIRATMPPLAGILHGAMVLEDGLTANLTADQLTRVLLPKVAGADNLDRLTAEMPLDYFVMFSSITTFIGNPGQGAYVAANGYLEGLARQRRSKGLPGLALAWGAISDVGVLARKKGLAEALAKRVGVVGMPAREALRLMAEALSLEAAGGPAVMAVGSLDWSAARRLPALASPTFAALTRGGAVADPAERQSIDLRALISAEPPETVRKRVAEVIIEEIATVLRVPKQDVSPTKRLGELGLDSLMAIELASALQDRLGLDDPPSGSVAAMTTYALADQLITLVSSGQPDDEARAALALNERHVGGEMDTAAIAPAIKAVAERSRDLKGLMH